MGDEAPRFSDESPVLRALRQYGQPPPPGNGFAGVAPMIAGAIGGIPASVATETVERAAEPFGEGLGHYVGGVLANLNPWGAKVADPQVSDIFARIDPVALAKQAAVSAALQQAQIAFHGSPHDFDRFSMDHIGEGEGNQSYGHGLYFAENPKTAEFYRNALAAPERIGPAKDFRLSLAERLRARADSMEAAGGADVAAKARKDAAVMDHLAGAVDEAKAGLKADATLANLMADKHKIDVSDLVKPGAGRTYAVDLPENEQLLDYDKPLSQQPPPVLDRLRAAGLLEPTKIANPERAVREAQAQLRIYPRLSSDEPAYSEFRDLTRKGDGEGLIKWAEANRQEWPRFAQEVLPSPLVGSDLYSSLARKAPQPFASDVLRDAGIPGLRYLDAGSRGASGGTHNFVIWDDSQIKPLAKASNYAELQQQLAQLKALRGGETP